MFWNQFNLNVCAHRTSDKIAPTSDLMSANIGTCILCEVKRTHFGHLQHNTYIVLFCVWLHWYNIYRLEKWFSRRPLDSTQVSAWHANQRWIGELCHRRSGVCAAHFYTNAQRRWKVRLYTIHSSSFSSLKQKKKRISNSIN